MNGASSSSSIFRQGAASASSGMSVEERVPVSFLNDGIQIRLVDQKTGKGVFATKNFKKGEEVLADLPIVTCQFSWNKKYKYKACDYCMRALETSEDNVRRLTQVPTLELPHPECCETQPELHVSCDECSEMYCSLECKTKAFEEYHRILCYHSETPPENFLALDEYWRSMHFPPETSNIQLLVRLLVKLHLDKDHSLTKRIAEYCQSTSSEDEELVHKILGDEYALQISTLLKLVTAVVNFPNIQQWLTLEGFLKLFVIIGRNSQGVGTSPFATYVTNVEKLEIPGDEKKALLDNIDHIYEVMSAVVGHFMDNEGVALYPIQSWVNHSCVPNCEVKFPEKNHRIGLIATEDIAAGDELTISYLDLADLTRSRYSRNKYLREHYLFECKCPKCLEQAGDEDCTTDEDEEDMSGSWESGSKGSDSCYECDDADITDNVV